MTASEKKFSRNEIEKFILALEHAPVAVFIMDKNWYFEYINPAFEKLSGFACEELLHKGIGETLYKNVQGVPESRREIISNLNKGESWKGELLTINKNGTTYWAETTASPYKNEKDEVEGYIVIQNDVTEKKAMEIALRESEKKYKTLVENSLDGIMIVKNNQILFTNDTFCNMLGYGCESIHNTPSTSFIHPHDRYRAIAISERRKKGDNSTITDNLRLMRSDGSDIDCEIYSSVIDYDGETASFFTIHDVTENRRMQRALAEKEELYRTLIEKSQDGVVLTKDRKFFLVNQSFCTIFGYTHNEIMALDPVMLLAPEHRERVLQMHDKRMSGDINSTESYIATFLHKTGKRLTIEINSSTVQIEGENLSFVTLRDITEQHALKEALEQSERKYRQLTEMLPQAIYELDAEGKPVYMNQTGLKMFGIEKGSAKQAVEFFIPEDMERMRQALKSEAENLQITDNGVEAIPSVPREYTAVSRDGNTFPVIIYGTSIIENNKVAGSRGIIIDISERKKMENALRESEEKYRTLIEKATDGIVITQAGKLKFANHAMCEMMKYNSEEMIERSFFDFVPPEDHEEMRQYHIRRMKGEIFNALYRSHIIRKDRKIITVELNARTLDYEGQPAAFIVVRDITERLQIENELKLAKDELEQLNQSLEARVRESSENLTEARTQLIRLQKENLQSQFEVLRQQVNPHFLFNSLNVLTSLIKLEPDLAEKFTEHLSKVYRYVLENKDNDLVDLKTELDFLDAYLFLLNIRFMDKIQVSINIDKEKTDLLILPLALQLLIENAIKHNSMSKKNPLCINLFIDENSFLNVVNNLQERESYIASTGVGLKNIEHRYLLLELPAPEFIKTDKQFVAKVPLKKC
jgi:PAS domain S-box-containing protein